MFKLNESSAIKLFGKTIPLLTLNQEEEALTDHAREDCCDRNLLPSSNSFRGLNSNDEYQAQDPREDQETIEKEFLKDKHEDNTSLHIREDFKDKASAERKTSSLKSSKNEEIREPTSSQEKVTLKKPDKILPCPRCNSKETKFCYYNNYNVNQPRHLCKNCQRYWTAGGTMRNLPVGSGRRKSKSSSALHYHRILISEAIQAAQAGAAVIGIHRNPSCENSNSRVLTFGSGSSMPVPSVFNISGKAQINVQNGFQTPEQRIVIEDNHSSECLITASHSLEKEGNASLYQSEGKNYQCFPSKVPRFTGPSWPYPWDSIQSSTAMLPPPTTLSPPGFPVSFHLAPTYRNYSVPSPWDVPLASSPRSSPTSAALGKHSRDENIVNLSPANSEKEKPSGKSNKSELGRALSSKTLRIDDPGETVKSSMLATLLIKSNKTNTINSGGLFDAFQSKSSDDRNHRLDSFLMLRVNPAALSRSLNFQENT